MKKLLLLLSVFSVTLGTAQSVPNYVPTNGLVGWWPFNGNANDISGNGNNGTVYGATLTNDRNGNSNSAYDLDGSNDYIQIPTSNFTNDSGFTFSIWLNANSLANNEDYLFQIGTDPGTRYFGFRLQGNGNGFSSRLAVEFRANNTYQFVSSNPNQNDTIGTGVDYMATVTYDNAGKIKIYLNDELIVNTTFQTNGSGTSNTSSLGGSFSFTNNPLKVGAALPTGYWFDGRLDDIGVWNRALDSSEVHTLYNMCQDSILNNPVSNAFQTVPGSAHFTTSHSDTSASFQWQQNNGTGWTDLSDFGIYSGTSTDSLILTGITASLNGYGYRCIIDACTGDTTDVAYLTVVDNVGIDESIKDLTVSPNPTSGFVSVNINYAVAYNVYNITGQKVAEGSTEGKIDLTKLPSGTYQLIINTKKGIIAHTIRKL